MVECRCEDEQVLRARIERRRALGLPTHQVGTWADFVVSRDRMTPQMGYPITDPHLIVDMGQPLSAALGEVVSWLEQFR